MGRCAQSRPDVTAVFATHDAFIYPADLTAVHLDSRSLGRMGEARPLESHNDHFDKMLTHFLEGVLASDATQGLPDESRSTSGNLEFCVLRRTPLSPFPRSHGKRTREVTPCG